MTAPYHEDPVAAYLRLQRGGGAPGEASQDPVTQYLAQQKASPPPSPPAGAEKTAPKRRQHPYARLGDLVVGGAERALQTINPFQDELTGLVQGAGAIWPGGRSPREAYVEERDASRRRVRQFRKEEPVANAAAVATGLGLSIAAKPLQLLGAAGRGAVSAGRAFLQGAGRSAAYAAPYAFGAAEGSASDQLKQTLTGTAVAGAAGGLVGPVLNRLSQRRPAGSLPKAIATGGTEISDVLPRRMALDPLVRAQTPAVTHVGPVEAAVLQRTLRTRAGARLGRVIEREMNELDVARRGVGEAKEALFATPRQISDPTLLNDLDDAMARLPDFKRVVRSVQRELKGKGQIVGPVEKTFSGSIGDALAAGIPEADIIARASDPKMMSLLLANPASRPIVMNQPVAEGFKYIQNNPWTLEAIDRLSIAGRRVLRKQYGAGGSASTGPIKQVVEGLQNRAREIDPEYDDVQRLYAQYRDVIRRTSKRTGARFDKAAPIGERFTVEAHPGAPASAPTSLARAGASPQTSGGQTSAVLTALKYVPQMLQRKAERRASLDLLKTGDAGSRVLIEAFEGGTPRKIPRGLYRIPGLLYPRPEEQP